MRHDDLPAAAQPDNAAGVPTADFSAPLAGATRGRLVFATGASGVTLRADPGLGDLLYRAHFARRVPSVRVQAGVITIHYRTLPMLDWLSHAWREPVAQIDLNPLLPWELEFRGGLSQLDADLRGLHLVALDLSSTSTARLLLPPPDGDAYIQLSGSASDLAFYRPAGVAVHFDLDHSATTLRLDEQQFGAIGGGLHWQSRHDAAAPRYAIRITGSVSNLTVGVW